MSDDEKESDSVGPNIDLEKIANESNADGDATDHGSSNTGTDHDGSADHDGPGDHDDHDHDANAESDEERHGHDAHDHDSEPAGRTTAPQSEFAMREAAIGGLVTAVGIVVAYAVPALLA